MMQKIHSLNPLAVITAKSKCEMRQFIVVAFLLLSILGASANIVFGDQWDFVYVNISPSQPTTSISIILNAWTWFGDPGEQFKSSTYSLNEHQIEMDIIMKDLHSPGTAWPAVMTKMGGSVHCGSLSPGDYNVTANILVIPRGGNVPVPFRTGAASFNVVPEPSTLMLLGTCVLGIFAYGCRKR
jgi:hypothetical protein